MIKINAKENLFNTLTLKEIEYIPCTTFSTVLITKILKNMNITIPSGHYNAEEIAKIASIGHEQVGLESIVLPFDLNFEAEAMGCDLKIKEDISSEIIDTPFDELEDIDISTDFINNARFPVIGKATNILHDEYDDKNIPIIASITGPFTVLCQILSSGTEGVLKHLNDNIVGVEDSLYSITTAIIEEIKFFNELNVDAISINEPAATPKILEYTKFKQILQPFLEELSINNNRPSVLHICGDTNPILKDMLTCSFEGVSISDEVDISKSKQLQAELNTPTRICGNISTDNILFRKNEKEIYDETMKTLSSGVDILSPGCMISPNTPIKNIKAMIKARNDFCNLS